MNFSLKKNTNFFTMEMPGADQGILKGGLLPLI
jgi:hypothetical protein